MEKGQSMWGGRFSKPPHELVEAFNASVHFDKRLALYDIQGSLAHVRMLAKQQIISTEEAETIAAGLLEIEEEIRAGEFDFTVALEDVHMNIESRLTERIGTVGGKLHTGRSRNDQVALDMHLFVKAEAKEVLGLVHQMQEVLLEAANVYMDVIIPGYTHLQRAQPVRLSHHLLAYFWMLQRDLERIKGVVKRADLSPLGAGALAGTTFPIDRVMVAETLGFAGIYENSLDAVSDRDYVLEFLFAIAMIMMHLSRFSEELILYSSTEFGWIELDDAYATGSSMMPQKKNPDVAELVRGKTGRVYGHLQALLTTCKGLPLAYNKDLQEDKEGLFDALDTVKPALKLFAGMISTMSVKKARTEELLRGDYSAATDLADALVRKGIPFRQAHEIVGKLVAYAAAKGVPFHVLTEEELQQIAPQLDPAWVRALTAENVVEARKSRGGTAASAVKEQLNIADKLWKVTI